MNPVGRNLGVLDAKVSEQHPQQLYELGGDQERDEANSGISFLEKKRCRSVADCVRVASKSLWGLNDVAGLRMGNSRAAKLILTGYLT
jgi:hypothetical protein